MAKSFSIIMTAPIKALLLKGKEAAEQNGVMFTGDTTSGSFQGKGFAGEYKTQGETLFVTLSQKPFFIPWSVAEAKVAEFLSYDRGVQRNSRHSIGCAAPGS